MNAETIEARALDKFFGNRRWHCGGPIPRNLLYNDGNLRLMRLDLCRAVDIAHAALARVPGLVKSQHLVAKYGWRQIGPRLIPKVLHSCERRHVPQDFVPGILLLYLELCEACPWRRLVDEDFNLKVRAPASACSLVA